MSRSLLNLEHIFKFRLALCKYYLLVGVDILSLYIYRVDENMMEKIADGSQKDGYWDGTRFVEAKVIDKQMKWFINTLLEDIDKNNTRLLKDPN